jgi:hypothetical protein
MADLIERFRSLDQIDSPDLWGDAAHRSPTVPSPPPHRSRERFVAAVVALTLAIAAIAFAFRALGGPPVGQPASEPSPSLAPETQGLITFTLDSASGQGTLTYGDSTRTYRATGFCADPDCRSATYDPIPPDSIKIPTEVSVGFAGDMEPVAFRVTSNSHQPSDFERTIDLAGDPSLHLPTGYFLFDITARAADGRYTHLYFGVVVADGAVGAPEPAAHVTSIHLAEPSSLASIVYGEGSAWVSLREGPSFNRYSIVRLDGGTGQQIAKIPVDTVPSWEVGGGGLVFANGSTWVAGRTYDRATQKDGGEIIQIDPQTNTVVHTITLPAPVADLAVDANGLWVLTSQGRTPTLERIDPASGDVAVSISLEGDVGRSVVSVDGTIFALVRTGAPTYGDIVYQVDPATNAVSERYTTKLSYNAVAETGGRMWMALGDGLFWIDPAAGQGRAVPDVSNTGDVVAAGAGGVWVLGPKYGRAPSRYDIASGTLGPPVDTGHHAPVAMAVAPGALWAANDDGTVTLIELSA